MKNDLFLTFAPYAFFLAGVMLWWPLAVLGMLTAALQKHFIAAVLGALLLDVLLGAPTGVMRVLSMPFTVFALFCIAAQMFFRRYVLAKDRRML